MPGTGRKGLDFWNRRATAPSAGRYATIDPMLDSRIPRATALLLATALAVSACGGDSGDGDGVTAATATPVEVATGAPTAPEPSSPTPADVGDAAPSAVPTPAGVGDAAPSAVPTPAGVAGETLVADPTPASEPANTEQATQDPGSTHQLLEFSDCGREYLCATLAVPVDHDDPSSGTLELEVGMIPARDPQRRLGAILVNPGGPGSSMDGILGPGEVLSPRIHVQFDVVGWNPRGVGHHVSPECNDLGISFTLMDLVPDSAAEEQAVFAAAEEVAEACQAGYADIGGRIGTADTVRDMDLIRAALGEEKLNFLGYSYGSLLGQLYADQFGHRSRAIVLDGVVDPSLSVEELNYQQMVAFNRVVEDVFALCTVPDCPFEDGDIRGAYEDLLARVEVSPLLDEDGNFVAGPGEVALALVIVTYVAPAWPLFYQAVADGLRGDGAELRRLASFYADETMGPFISIGCTDYGAFTRQESIALADKLAEAAGDLGRFSAGASYFPCVFWDEVAEPLVSGPVRAPDAPTVLVLGNRGDNATPYEWAVGAAESLDHSLLVSYDGKGHTSYGKSDCVDIIVDNYLMDLALPPGDVVECG